VLGEDVEVWRYGHDLDLDDITELDELTGAEFAVTDHRIGAGRTTISRSSRAAPNRVGRRIRFVPSLDHALEDGRTRCLGEGGELDKRVLGVADTALGPYADQDNALEAQRAVLDLGDVLKLGS
jgi:hypothetical protein